MQEANLKIIIENLAVIIDNMSGPEARAFKLVMCHLLKVFHTVILHWWKNINHDSELQNVT